MAKNKALHFHAHRAIFVDLMRPEMTRQQARFLWHRMYKTKEGVADFPRHQRTAYNAATRLLTTQMREQQKEAA
ncbi:MAG: hypothetical protein LC793_07350 [Thermomicrobia bacterium]|nr:hypothetical protein [Thermomicrobia bacterium]